MDMGGQSFCVGEPAPDHPFRQAIGWWPFPSHALPHPWKYDQINTGSIDAVTAAGVFKNLSDQRCHFLGTSAACSTLSDIRRLPRPYRTREATSTCRTVVNDDTRQSRGNRWENMRHSKTHSRALSRTFRDSLQRPLRSHGIYCHLQVTTFGSPRDPGTHRPLTDEARRIHE